MAKNSYRRTKNGFSYSGDLQKCITAAKRRLDNLHKNTAFITRVYDEAKRQLDAHFKAIETATDFIEVASEHLKKQQATKNETSNPDE